MLGDSLADLCTPCFRQNPKQPGVGRSVSMSVDWWIATGQLLKASFALFSMEGIIKCKLTYR